MAISNVSGAAQYIPQQVNSQQVKLRKDADSDSDGTKAGQVEKAGEAGKATETVKAQVKPTQSDAQARLQAGNIENRKQPVEASPPTGSSGQNINIFA